MKASKDLGGIKALCYLGIFILLIFIILPPLFRFLFSEEEIVTEEKKELIMNLNCVKEENFVEYKVKTTINTNYVEGVISDSMFTYEVEFTDDLFSEDDIDIEEYESLKKINNVDFEENENKYILRINYKKFDYSNEPLLTEHRKVITEQLYTYTENSFECKTTKVQ